MKALLRAEILERSIGANSIKRPSSYRREFTTIGYDADHNTSRFDGDTNLLRYGIDWNKKRGGAVPPRFDVPTITTQSHRANASLGPALLKMFPEDKEVLRVLLKHALVSRSHRLAKACLHVLPVT